MSAPDCEDVTGNAPVNNARGHQLVKFSPWEDISLDPLLFLFRLQEAKLPFPTSNWKSWGKFQKKCRFRGNSVRARWINFCWLINRRRKCNVKVVENKSKQNVTTLPVERVESFGRHHKRVPTAVIFYTVDFDCTA